MTLRVCILSDTHGELDARIAKLAASCAITVHGGDVGAAAVLDALGAGGSQVIAVRGNNDVPAKWPQGEQARLAALPNQAELDLPGGILAVEHGHQANPARARHDRLRRRHPRARAIVYGHSHRLVCDLGERPWVLNPGAAGRSRTFGGPSCLLLEVTSPDRWHLETHRFPLSGRWSPQSSKA